MIVKANMAVTLVAQNTNEAEKLLNQWIEGLIDKDLIIEGEVSFIENLEENDFDPPEHLYDFPGYDNYPGNPI